MRSGKPERHPVYIHVDSRICTGDSFKAANLSPPRVPTTKIVSAVRRFNPSTFSTVFFADVRVAMRTSVSLPVLPTAGGAVSLPPISPGASANGPTRTRMSACAPAASSSKSLTRSSSQLPLDRRHQASRPISTVRPKCHAKAWYTNPEACAALAETWSDSERAWHRAARADLVETLAQKRAESRRRALERRELFPCKRLKEQNEAAAIERASAECAAADIVFLPRLPAVRAAFLERVNDPIEMSKADVEAVRQEVAGLYFTSKFEGLGFRAGGANKTAAKLLSALPGRTTKTETKLI